MNEPKELELTPAEDAFVQGWEALTDETYRINVEKGFFAGPVRMGDQCMLIASEVAEAYEAWRKDLNDDKLTHRLGLEVELADAVIRIMNLGRHLGLDVATALVEKSRYNATRPYMHGGKKT